MKNQTFPTQYFNLLCDGQIANLPSNRLNSLIRLFLSIIALFFLTPAVADEDKEADEKEEEDTIEEMVADFEKIEGLFTLYRDPETGDLYMEIAKEQLGQEFISVSYYEDGLVESGTFRGMYEVEQIIEPRRYYDRIEFIEKSTAFYFDPESSLYNARDANIPLSVMASLSIEATTPSDKGEGQKKSNANKKSDDKPGTQSAASTIASEGSDREDGSSQERYLVSVDDLFLSETLQQLIPSPGSDRDVEEFSIGSLSSEKTRYDAVHNYPENTDIIINYVFDNPRPSNEGGDAVVDARTTTYKVRHSLLKMPDAKVGAANAASSFEPRFDDYRIGYFFNRVTDLTSTETVNYRDVITRWRLEKKNPSAPLSQPVKPITWWIENTTPHEYRKTIKDGVLAWNAAFAKAGFQNAIEVKVQPDNASWDAGDLRYNVLRWTSSPNPPFGGYGPSFTNPRTGEILGADIMLEFAFVTNRLRFEEIYNPNISSSSRTVFHVPERHRFCGAGHHLQMATQFGRTVLETNSESQSVSQLIKESLYYLVLHEVGHTLGLNHNMKASIQFSPEEVHKKSITKGAPTASVMDYPAINIAPLGIEQGDYYMQRPGPYDEWAIEFGYRPNLDNEERMKLLGRAHEKGLAFGNDTDDMRAPGSGIDPRVNINDMSSDPVLYGVERIELIRSLLPDLAEKYSDRGSWQDLLTAYLVITRQHGDMANIISRQIGGVLVERLSPAQLRPSDQSKAAIRNHRLGEDLDTPKAPYLPVSRASQKQAMRALAQYVYARNAFTLPASLAQRLQPQRRGFDFDETTEDPKIHELVLTIQKSTLDHLLHPVVLERMTDSALYGGRYDPTEMMLDLNRAIIGNDLKANPNGFRRNLQIAYLRRLSYIIDHPAYSASASSAALAAIEDVKGRFGLFDFTLTPTTKAHRLQVKRIISGIE